MDQVTAADINKLIRALNQCCDSAKAQTYKFLKVFFKEMHLDQKLRADSMERVTPYYFSSHLKEVPSYTKKELVELLVHARKTIHFFEVDLMFLGLRIGEIRGLRETDFDEKERTIHIGRQIVRQDETVYSADGEARVKRKGVAVKATKTINSNRIIRVPSVTFDLLREHEKTIDDAKKRREKNGLIWDDTFTAYICRSDTGKIKSESTFLIALKRICSSARLPIVSPHDLRHTFATIMDDNSVNLKKLAEIMGHHSSNFTLKTYVEKKQPVFEGMKEYLDILEHAVRREYTSGASSFETCIIEYPGDPLMLTHLIEEARTFDKYGGQPVMETEKNLATHNEMPYNYSD